MKSASLKDFCTFVQGGRHKLSGKHFVEQGFPAYGAGGMNGYLPNPEFNRDAVVLSSIGARCGKCFLAEGEWASLANTQVIFPDPQKCDVRFLWFQLNDETRWPRKGMAQPFIRPSDVKAHRVFLPPLEEQRRIASILDRADALRRKRQSAIELLDGLKSTVFLNLFGNPTTNAFGWPIQNFGDLVVNESNKRIPVKSSDRDRRAGEYPYYGASGIIDTIDDFIYDGRRLLIGEDGANLLSRSTPVAFFAEGKFWANNHAHVLKESSNCNLYYLRSYINQIDLSPYITGSAQPKLNRANMDKIKVMTPPLDLQIAFEKILRSLELMGDRYSSALRSSQSFFASLQRQAFSGQL